MSLPKVSLVLFSYNQEKFILEAAKSCLSQDYSGELEILFSDDSSTDNTFHIIQTLKDEYLGKHSLNIHRNTKNLGIAAHYNQAIAMTSGELIFTAAGDDISSINRVSTIVNAWLDNRKKTDLITSDLQKIRLNGSASEKIIVANLKFWDTPEKWIRKRPYVVGAAHAFTRRLHNQFGDFLPELVYEDQVMAFRASFTGGGLKVEEPLVLYREGGISQDKSNLATPLEYINWSKKNYLLQKAQYLQIQVDLKTVAREDLWNKKLTNKLNGALYVLALHQENIFINKIKVFLQFSNVFILFKLKHLIYIAHPKFAISIQKIQQKIKKLL